MRNSVRLAAAVLLSVVATTGCTTAEDSADGSPEGTETATPAPSYTATEFEVAESPIKLELVGCENRVPSDSDRALPVAEVRMSNNGDESLTVRLSGAVQLDELNIDGYPEGWYGTQMSGGRELSPGEVYVMDLSPDFDAQANYGPGRHLACRIDRAAISGGDDPELEMDPGLGAPSAGDVDEPLTTPVNRSVPSDSCVEVDGLYGFRDSLVVRTFVTQEACAAALG